VGTETSSRNSEVIHAGLYYPAGSLKTALCIRGAAQLYAHCRAHHVAHKRCGKWIVAQDARERASLEALHAHAVAHGIRVRWVGAAEAHRREPHVRAAAGALESCNTGIVDSHALMRSLLGGLTDAGGDVALNASVVGARRTSDGYDLVVASPSSEDTLVSADVVVNAAGLAAVDVANLIAPPHRQPRTPHYCKGTYYVPAAAPSVGTLIYPAPVPAHEGLGTHLTMDLAGAFRFGPDVRWVDSPLDLAATDDGTRRARDAVRTYLPAIGELRPDYAGIRPKLHPPGTVGATDFWIRCEDGHDAWVNLLGIESPGLFPPLFFSWMDDADRSGLTSCLAIAEYVEEILYGKKEHAAG